LILERPMTDVQFSTVKEGPSCSRLGTVVGLSASANDLVDCSFPSWFTIG